MNPLLPFSKMSKVIWRTTAAPGDQTALSTQSLQQRLRTDRVAAAPPPLSPAAGAGEPWAGRHLCLFCAVSAWNGAGQSDSCPFRSEGVADDVRAARRHQL